MSQQSLFEEGLCIKESSRVPYKETLLKQNRGFFIIHKDKAGLITLLLDSRLLGNDINAKGV